MSEVMTQCPPDHPLMKAWKEYEASESYRNSYNWATLGIDWKEPEDIDPTANRWTPDHFRQFVTGSMWAAFMAGFAAAGGKTNV